MSLVDSEGWIAHHYSTRNVTNKLVNLVEATKKSVHDKGKDGK